jgi:hypothetical protein
MAVMLLVEMAASACVAGCSVGDDLPRESVSGTVSFKGDPLKSGMIQFQPAQGEATAGGSGIIDGRYSIPRSEGLVPGKYQVMITGVLTPPVAAKAEMPGESLPTGPAVELIPTKYNSKTELTAQVTKDGPNRFNFELKVEPATHGRARAGTARRLNTAPLRSDPP